jgi:protoheme IX farnesyltransferase
MIFGLIDNIIIYSYLSKRRTSWNIILGSFSGGAPIIIGYTTATHTLNIIPILWAALIVIWTPVHIWSLALFYKEDYRKAGVPMLPTVTSEKTAIRCIASSSVILILFSILLPMISHTYLNYIYISVVSIADIIIVYFALKLIIKPTEKDAWKLFKATSPYLAILLTTGIISHIM